MWGRIKEVLVLTPSIKEGKKKKNQKAEKEPFYFPVLRHLIHSFHSSPFGGGSVAFSSYHFASRHDYKRI